MATNGAPGEAATAVPSLAVLAQYVKDFSFENPAAPRSLRAGGQNPNIQVNVNVNARGMSETDVEVEVKIDGQAGEGADTVFRFDVVYAGVFRIEGVPAESRMPIVLIECPRLLFPFVRQIIADAVRNGGFPPLMLDPIDFAALYRQRLSEQAAASIPEGAVLS
ncbi:protein-export chaperone SecB [Terrihabitans rhizophilus]|jgi:preprotein translocase subunit SecB|uniref:Protein-export protein SecB n=1 Tax=Terrihabitans rhizophilus TaxID=3092662 RepID=A0ABU4RRS0_9HYPH|nr:protein-export chaperone SecB [Terrihabitans sp. PJ23]MDX6807527.1 protein-export chaperone SecB [Terrihabitans sp. PJ23]